MSVLEALVFMGRDKLKFGPYLKYSVGGGGSGALMII